MNLEELKQWLKEINVKLARIQQPNAQYLASAGAWKRLGRHADWYDGRSAILLLVEWWSDHEVELNSVTFFDIEYTTADPNIPDLDSHDDMLAYATKCGLSIYYSDDDLTIFDLP